MIAGGNRKRIGLALSGGGFRATLFHLGMVRFLRDADILPSVTHITSVSGGSVLAAHLVLNWDRYTGTPDQFDAVAAEVIKFMRLDVRNRIVRRAPLAIPIHLSRWLMRMRRDRRLTRTGMLEMYYQHFLYGDTCMFQLPEHPQLHILSTNLTEGSLCSFTRDGVIFQKRLPGELFRFERLHAGLATVPLAVTASSAFPGFFPPLQVNGAEVGAADGQFNRQVFTDGGVFDNLGVRMFRNIERTWIGRESQLTLDDMYDAECVVKALNSASSLHGNTPLGRIRQMYQEAGDNRPPSDDHAESAVSTLSEVIGGSALYREPSFQAVQPDDPEAAALLESARVSGKDLEHHDRVWLNRQLVETVLRQVTGRRCLRPMSSMFDQVIVSDAGKHLQARTEVRASGLIGTAMRASDIGMDRVWQLEKETFGNQPGFLFMSLSDLVEEHDDATALHPEIQRRLPEIRTDLDAFSPLEISTLIRHGYCVARSTCRREPELFGHDLPSLPPWDPVDHGTTTATGSGKPRRMSLLGNQRGPTAEVVAARVLQHSAARRVWSRLFDYKDWVSYVYLALLLPLLSIVPLSSWRYWHERGEAKKTHQAIDAIARSGQDQQVVADLVRNRPLAPWQPPPYEDVADFEPADYRGISFTSDTLIYDLRQGPLVVPTSQKTEGRRATYLRRRIRLHKEADYSAGAPFRYQFGVPASKAEVRCLNTRLNPVLRRRKTVAGTGGDRSQWELRLDLARVPVETPVDIQLEIFLLDRSDKDVNATIDPHEAAQVEARTGMLSMWLLLPENNPYESYRLLSLDPKSPNAAEVIYPSEGEDRSGGTIIYWNLLDPDPERRYECHWVWQRAAEP
ncbi:MAG TPA: patatin-like phospholipase family protein [Pirellulales bacterium]|nr:patatin-like phospholipase family protein [Pirellulales bacterium]